MVPGGLPFGRSRLVQLPSVDPRAAQFNLEEGFKFGLPLVRLCILCIAHTGGRVRIVNRAD